jgi:hypothetical protein
MGGLCSVCCLAQEHNKPGAWEDLSGGWTARESFAARGIPLTIHVPDAKRGAEHQPLHLTRPRNMIRLEALRAVDQDDNDDDCADDERDDTEDEEDGDNSVVDDLSLACSDASDDSPISTGGDLHNISSDLILSDSDCDDGDCEEDQVRDKENDDDEDDANLLGESLFSTERDESDGADDEDLLPNTCSDQPLVILSSYLKQETDSLLQFCPDKEPRLVKPSFVEQYNCLGTVL